MIIRMSKILVLGPLPLLEETLSAIRELGIMHFDESAAGYAGKACGPGQNETQAKNAAIQRQLYEKLGRNIDALLAQLHAPSAVPFPKKISPISINKLVLTLPDHLAECGKRKENIEELARRLAGYQEYKSFLDALGCIEKGGMRGDVQYLGVTADYDPERFRRLRSSLESRFQGKALLEFCGREGEAKAAGLAMAETECAEEVRGWLEEKGIQLVHAPEDLAVVPFACQYPALETKISRTGKQLARLREQEATFSLRWSGRYEQSRAWLKRQLEINNVSATVERTRMCFVVHGWIRAADFGLLRGALEERFQGRVAAEEQELVEEDFSRIPTALHNPEYFRPFEIFTRLLPMPPYASFDITPFIGIFFPLFFGMMLGDMGYGLILLLAARMIIRKSAENTLLRDAGRILFISAIYSIVFGLLYGELLGTVGRHYLGLGPLLFDRHASIVPMMLFAMSAGVVHVLIGLVLGTIISVRQKKIRETVIKLVNILIIVCICAAAASTLIEGMAAVRQPFLLLIAASSVFLVVFGGLMAPLELLKNVGNIISYARIMAIGMTSVLLAFVANDMAGRLGSVWAGVFVAAALHLFNLLLGVFAPTIHSLRLHYVEFLSKFMEPGGREFKPLGGKQVEGF